MLSFKDIVIDNKPAADGSVDIALSPNQRGQPIVRPIDYRISGKPCILLQFTTEKTAVPSATARSNILASPLINALPRATAPSNIRPSSSTTASSQQIA